MWHLLLTSPAHQTPNLRKWIKFSEQWISTFWGRLSICFGAGWAHTSSSSLPVDTSAVSIDYKQKNAGKWRLHKAIGAARFSFLSSCWSHQSSGARSRAVWREAVWKRLLVRFWSGFLGPSSETTRIYRKLTEPRRSEHERRLNLRIKTETKPGTLTGM